MMRPPAHVAVYLCSEPVDFRKAIGGLSVLVEQAFGLDPFAPALYVFTNRHRNRIKILYWERNGFCLWQKRLERQKFRWPQAPMSKTLTLTGQELNWLLDGFDIWNHPPHKMLTFQSVS